jgi:hypothetical protein
MTIYEIGSAPSVRASNSGLARYKRSLRRLSLAVYWPTGAKSYVVTHLAGEVA